MPRAGLFLSLTIAAAGCAPLGVRVGPPSRRAYGEYAASVALELRGDVAGAIGYYLRAVRQFPRSTLLPGQSISSEMIRSAWLFMSMWMVSSHGQIRPIEWLSRIFLDDMVCERPISASTSKPFVSEC